MSKFSPAPIYLPPSDFFLDKLGTTRDNPPFRGGVSGLCQGVTALPASSACNPSAYLITLQKRAKSKHLTQRLVSSLASLNSELKKSYMNSYYCSSIIEQRGQNFISKYCKNRWCVVCNRVSTAKLLNGYLPILSQFKEPYFLTLTQRNCNKDSLGDMFRHQAEFMSRYSDNRRQLKKRGQMPQFVALRKLECTHNATTNEYHPHYHLIIDGYDSAKHLLDAWCDNYKDRVNKEGAQQLKPLDGTEKGFKELFKYFTKITSKTDKRQLVRGGFKTVVNVEPLDHIFTSIKGLRIFQPVNIKAVKEDDAFKELKSETDIDAEFSHKDWTWCDLKLDWYYCNEPLCGYKRFEQIDKVWFNPKKFKTKKK